MKKTENSKHWNINQNGVRHTIEEIELIPGEVNLKLDIFQNRAHWTIAPDWNGEPYAIGVVSRRVFDCLDDDELCAKCLNAAKETLRSQINRRSDIIAAINSFE